MKDNLNLWKSVETTNMAHTQKGKISGQFRTTVKPAFRKEKATEVFGPYGLGWGVIVGSENYERIYIDDGECILQYTANMFYIYEGQRGEFPIASAIKERQIYKRGTPDQYLNFDHEAIKKVRTDALTKGLSELGFNADIYKGWADDDAYAQYAQEQLEKENQAKLEKEAEARAKADIEIAETWKNETLPNMLKEYAKLTTVKAVTTLNTEHIRKATAMGDKNAIGELAKAKEAQIEKLKSAMDKAQEVTNNV